MSGPMVRAALDGRKTQTRRVMKMPWADSLTAEVVANEARRRQAECECPYGQPGDRLWVRESFSYREYNPEIIDDLEPMFWYWADGNQPDNAPRFYNFTKPKPSIHMPRFASRLTLEITEVRVERVQSISPDDAIAEGLTKITKDGGRTWKYGIPDRDGQPGSDDGGWDWHRWRQSPVDAYEVLWDALNAKRGYGWDVNPWVWVLSFRVAAPAPAAVPVSQDDK